MNELLQAAKAVIDAEDIPTRCNAIGKLRAAVERAENQKVDFDNWWNQTEIWPSEYAAAASAWIAAQQAERERCAILCERLPYGSGLAGKTYSEALRGVGHGGELAAGTNTNLEKIDE